MPDRERLSRDRVLRTAVELADETGFDGLSMRKLADRFGVVPMALYKHVADKNDLLDGMVDLVFAEVEVGDGDDWRTTLRVRAIELREALRRHPWAIGRMETGTPGPANLKHHNAVLACLRGPAGFDFATAVEAYNLMDSYIYGSALQDHTLAGDIPAELDRRHAVVAARGVPVMDDYPYLMEVIRELGGSGYDFGRGFLFGLDLVLDGIARLTMD